MKNNLIFNDVIIGNTKGFKKDLTWDIISFGKTEV